MRGRNKKSPEQRAAEQEWKAAADEVLFTRDPTPEQQARARELYPQTGEQ
jgi:hypothetical protein